VIDPLISTECASTALALYRKHRGERPVSAVIYTHSHVDHFGGVKGVVSEEQVKAGEVPIWAPAGFLEHAVSENVLAGGAMARRAGYMFAPGLERGPNGQVDAGIGKTTSSGSVTLIPPTHEVSSTGEEGIIDGVPLVFQLVASADVARALSIEQLWDAMGARLDGPRAWETEIVIAWDFTDVAERWTVTVENTALSAVAGRLAEDAQARVTLTRAAFDAVLLGESEGAALFASGAIAVEGDAAKLGEFLGLLDQGDLVFAIVTP
jgi:alkyl sulfatase BDS1-like metallo-beta-lactamase superfamily hydrolase